MTAFEFRFGESDWEQFERGDEWFLYDEESLYDATPDELDQLETAMGYRIVQMMDDLGETGAKAVRAATWIARRKAGIVEPWDTYQPKVMRIVARVPDPKPVEGDAVPPESPSPQSSTGDGQETSSPTSDPVSPSPTRGSRQRTSAK